MIYTTDILHLKEGQRTAITLGKFDGLHRGHQKLINHVLEIGKGGYETVIFTFDVSPLIKLGNKKLKNLLTNEERRELAESWGIDYLIECPFTDAVVQMEAEEFVTKFLVERLHVAAVVVGTDFHFGHNRTGTPQLLQKMGETYGFTVDIMDKETDGQRVISSTYVREELEKGNIEKVNELLGYTFFTRGEIVHGRKLGRTIGIPTTNLIPPKQKKFPPNGVYITESNIEGRSYHGITNVGYKPTVMENFLGVETYLFDCNEDLYGKEAEVLFYHYLRPERKFNSLDELKKQLLINERQGREFFQKVRRDKF